MRELLVAFALGVAVASCGEADPPCPTRGDSAACVADAGAEDTADSDVAAASTLEAADLASCGFIAAPDGGFDDRTAWRIPSRACLYAYGDPTEPFDPDAPDSALTRRFEIKFTVVGLLSDAPVTHYYRNDFFRFHDEWWWFRLLNGRAAPGSDTAPVASYAFTSVAEIYRALATVSPLPLGLVFIGATAGAQAGRLYAPRFYDLAGVGAAGLPRVYGLGTLIHDPPDPRRAAAGRLHAFQLEYGEQVDAATLGAYFSALRASLPATVAAELRFLARSPAQEALVRGLRASDHPLRTRLLLPDEVSARGGYAPYHRGVTAGFLKLVEPSDPTHDLPPDAIAVLARVPDDLPPVRAILSDVPQTPLAHVALLAEARDTPNAWAEGLLRDSRLQDLAWLRRPMIVAVGDALSLTPMSLTDYEAWLALARPLPVTLSPLPDPEAEPRTLDLAPRLAAPVALVGGKSAGLARLLGSAGVDTPPSPLAITIRPYAAWLRPLRPTLEAIAAHPAMADRHVRYAVLDGLPAFESAFASDPGALAGVDRFLAADGATTPFAPILAAGGLQAWLRAQPLPYAELRALREALASRFSALSPRQGLRFRSSATVEDIPGFNGAGLYRSTSGFLEPQLQDSAEDRARSVERAILDVWSSYWGFAPWEERSAAGLDHFAGAMAVLVHPRFDDDRERANLVMTMRCDEREGATPTPTPRCQLVINAQPGSRSVTNPGADALLPEIVEVTGAAADDLIVTRRQAASALAASEVVVPNAVARDLHAAARRHVEAWLAADNASRLPSEAAHSLTLDYELKWVGDGWPALADGSTAPSRLIWRQARVLDRPQRVPARPDPWLGGAAPLTEHLPVDLNPDAEAVTALTCARRSEAGEREVTLRVYRVALDEKSDIPSENKPKPFIYKVFLHIERPLPGVAEAQPVGRWLPHTALIATETDDGALTLALTPAAAAIVGIDRLGLARDLDGADTLALTLGETTSSGTCAPLREETLWRGPTAFLRALLAASAAVE